MSDQQQQSATTPSSAQPAQSQPSSQTESQEQGEQGQGQTSEQQQQQAPDAPMKQEESDAPTNTDLDAVIDADVEMNTDENIAANGAAGGAGADETGAGGVGNPVQDDPVPTSVDALAAAAAPSKKETSLREFLGKMDEYAPIVCFKSSILYASKN